MFPKIDFLGTPTDTYAICMLLSFIVVFIAVFLLKPKEFPFGYVFLGLIVIFFFSYVGAALFNIILYIPQYTGQNIKRIIKTSGVAYLGAPILSFLALWALCKIRKMPFLVVADYVAPFFMLERLFGRIGCLGYGCCYGIPSNLPWAYPFKSWGITNIVPRHPTQAYAIIVVLAIFVSGRYLYKRTKSLPGVYAKTYKEVPSAGITFFYVFLCYGFLRFINEFIRAEGPFIYGPLKISHVILAIFVIVSIIGLRIIIKNSVAKDEILKALKGAFVRLVVWLVASNVVLLSAISIYNYSH